jgi:hypothetical protein
MISNITEIRMESLKYNLFEIEFVQSNVGEPFEPFEINSLLVVSLSIL